MNVEKVAYHTKKYPVSMLVRMTEEQRKRLRQKAIKLAKETGKKTSGSEFIRLKIDE